MESTQKENELTPIRKAALDLLDRLKEQVAESCDERALTESLAQFHPESNGYFKRSDYINADKAMNILQLGYNRAKFYALLKEYGITNNKLNNMPIGYKRAEIERLAVILKVEHRLNRSKYKSVTKAKSLWVD